jgi:hypothetical protein
MRTSRRALAAFMAALVLQLPLLGAAAPCTHMSGAPKSASDAPAQQSHHGGSDCADAPAEDERPAESGGGCIAMLTCSVSIAGLVSSITALEVSSADETPVVHTEHLTARTVVPELPPPRL